MQKLLTLLTLLFLSLFLMSCDKEKEDMIDEDSPDRVERNDARDPDMKDDNSDSESGNFDDFTKNMENLKDAFSGGKSVTPVDFRDLKKLLPEELDEMNRVNASGERTSSMGINVSKSEADYRSEDGKKRMDIKITDLGSVSGLTGFATFAWAFGDIDKESDTGFERTIDYKGHRGYEKYNFKNNSGKIQTLVAKRFMVEVDGNGVTHEELQDALGRIDIGVLEDMKDLGVEENKKEK